MGAPLETLVTLQPSASCTLNLAGGSILDYEGDAFINAANEGCTGGFGVDEMVNKAGGDELKEARKQLGGCKTGGAKVTRSFNHTRTSWIVHAVGPVYRVNKLKQGFDESDERAVPYMHSLDPLLVSAYRASLERANEVSARKLGFCMLSAGVFRGARALEDIVQIAVRTLAQTLKQNPVDFESVTLVGYTQEERETMQAVGEQVKLELESGGDGSSHDLVRNIL